MTTTSTKHPGKTFTSPIDSRDKVTVSPGEPGCIFISAVHGGRGEVYNVERHGGRFGKNGAQVPTSPARIGQAELTLADARELGQLLIQLCDEADAAAPAPSTTATPAAE